MMPKHSLLLLFYLHLFPLPMFDSWFGMYAMKFWDLLHQHNLQHPAIHHWSVTLPLPHWSLHVWLIFHHIWALWQHLPVPSTCRSFRWQRHLASLRWFLPQAPENIGLLHSIWQEDCSLQMGLGSDQIRDEEEEVKSDMHKVCQHKVPFHQVAQSDPCTPKTWQ